MIECINLSPFSSKVLPLLRISCNETHHLSACSLGVLFFECLREILARVSQELMAKREKVWGSRCAACELREKVCLHMFMCACGTFSVHSRHCENQTISCSEQKGKWTEPWAIIKLSKCYYGAGCLCPTLIHISDPPGLLLALALLNKSTLAYV
jgi:hypothetical protein